MATLVLSTVGTALGGPLGGAIGALIGQSIDQQLFGPGPRRGPRLGDLAVQTSTYGTPLPRIYGRMRVAGSVIWATDLEESSERQSGGKGQPEVVTFSYSASFAVALSSRTAQDVGRIWADGKLIRGAAGDFKVKTVFRFHPGGESQAVDPLIATIEGIDSTPAYRGLALAVFENLELGEFGNRIPFLTFELIADPVAPELGLVLADASDGTIACNSIEPLTGYAAHGASMAAAVQPLIEHFGVELFDNGQVLRSPEPGAPLMLDADDLGCSGENDRPPRIERTQVPARSLPASLTLGYHDPARDYQTGQMRAAVGRNSGAHEAVEIPAVMEAGEAKRLAETSLARRWAQRDRLIVRLPPAYLGLEPGIYMQLPSESAVWTVHRVTAEAMTLVAELQPLWWGAPAIAAEPGRSLPSIDIIAVPTALALFDLPDLGLNRDDVPVLHLAACSSSAGWRAVPIEILVGGETRAGQSAFGETVLGRTKTVLGDGQAALFDLRGTVEVELTDGEHWLENRDDAALVQGANLAAVGSELIQFGRAVTIGPGRFRLERLLRGRRGTEWAMSGHVLDEPFALLDPATLRAIELPNEAVGMDVQVTALGLGDGSGTSISALAGGEALRPPSPVHLHIDATGSGGLEFGWVRRSRDGWAWLDEMDAPLGETAERYRVTIETATDSIEQETSVPSAIFTSEQLGPLGSGAATATVAQIGDRALSRPTSAALTF